MPVAALAPPHPPDAMQLVEFVLCQASTVDSPAATLEGDADKSTLATGVESAVATVTDCVVDPAGPVHVRANDVDFASGPAASLPASGFAPLHPPEAVQLSALLVSQVRVLLP